jgi:hypothetical protein
LDGRALAIVVPVIVVDAATPVHVVVVEAAVVVSSFDRILQKLRLFFESFRSRL